MRGQRWRALARANWNSLVCRRSFSFLAQGKMSGEEPMLKKSRPCSGEKVLIGTHNGNFHCDEALACYMLRKLSEYKDARIVRSRDPQELDKCDIVVDVGGVYDPPLHRYDHHQKTFDGSMNSLTAGKRSWTTKLSSAGLVYLHFGQRVISAIAGTELKSDLNDELYEKLYENFVEEVDAVDNGIEHSDGQPRYKVTTSISHRVSYLNPSWNSTGQNPDELFEEAMELVGSEFTGRLMSLKEHWLPARELVQNAFQERFNVHESGTILHLEIVCPWKEHLFDLEGKRDTGPVTKFVLYHDQNGQYRVQCVPVESQGFTNRLSLPQAWCGLRGEDLSRESSISGCIFVHSSGFIGGNMTYEGALEMAAKALTM